MKRPLLWAAAAACIICAVIVNFFPQLLIKESSYNDGHLLEADIRIEQIEIKEKTIYIFAGRKGLHGQCLITAFRSDHSPDSFAIGKNYHIKCRYREFQHARNQGNFDEGSYYRSVGVFEKYELISIISESGRTDLIRQMLFYASRYISDFVNETGRRAGDAGERSAGVLCAMLTGSRHQIDEDTGDLYRLAGIYHILAISGLHISFLGMGLFALLRKRTGIRPAAFVSFAVVLLFCLMSKSSISAVRAVVMFGVSLGAKLTGRKYDMLNSMSLAVLLLLICEPFYITNSAFRLSFTAIWAAAVPARMWEQVVGGGKIAGSAVRSLSVTAFTLPLIARMYYAFPVYGILLNLLVIPLASWVLASGAAGAGAGVIFPALGRFLMAAGLFILIIIERLCMAAASLPGSYIVCGYKGPGRCLLYYMIIAAASACLYFVLKGAKKFRNSRRESDNYRKRIKLLTVLISVPVAALLIVIISAAPARHGLEIFCIDVDQGQCVVMRTPSDRVYMFDAGSTSVNDVYRYRISSALRYQGISKIDICFLSHPDTDHISAVYEMLKDRTIDIRQIMTPPLSGNDNYIELEHAAENAGVPFVQLRDGMKISDGECSIICLHPDRAFVPSDPNDNSAVLSISWNDFSCLITGDISGEVEERILENESLKADYDLFIASHHGSKYSNSRRFLDAIRPQATVISAGVDNRYGHPHVETMKRLKEVGSNVYVTAQYGEIMIMAYPGRKFLVTNFMEKSIII